MEGPHEESFDEKYNKRLEFPLSLVSAILIHVLVGAVLVFVLFYLMGIGGDPSGVPVKLVNLEGMDEAGAGAVGSGGKEEPLFKAEVDLAFGPKSLVVPSKLPDVKINPQQPMKPSITMRAAAGNLHQISGWVNPSRSPSRMPPHSRATWLESPTQGR
jgi:hypothetical protein